MPPSVVSFRVTKFRPGLHTMTFASVIFMVFSARLPRNAKQDIYQEVFSLSNLHPPLNGCTCALDLLASVCCPWHYRSSLKTRSIGSHFSPGLAFGSGCWNFHISSSH